MVSDHGGALPPVLTTLHCPNRRGSQSGIGYHAYGTQGQHPAPWVDRWWHWNDHRVKFQPVLQREEPRFLGYSSQLCLAGYKSRFRFVIYILCAHQMLSIITLNSFLKHWVPTSDQPLFRVPETQQRANQRSLPSRSLRSSREFHSIESLSWLKLKKPPSLTNVLQIRQLEGLVNSCYSLFFFFPSGKRI